MKLYSKLRVFIDRFKVILNIKTSCYTLTKSYETSTNDFKILPHYSLHSDGMEWARVLSGDAEDCFRVLMKLLNYSNMHLKQT